MKFLLMKERYENEEESKLNRLKGMKMGVKKLSKR